MTKSVLLNRTKQLSLRVIKLIESLPKNKISDTLGNNCLGVQRLSEQIIERLVVQNPPLILSISWQSWRRKQTSQCIGWNYLWNLVKSKQI